MTDPDSLELRDLERLLFRAWCIWLCSPGLNPRQQNQAKEQFRAVAQRFEQQLNTTAGPLLRSDQPETVDLLFVPYVERMNASLAYYKGYRLRREHPSIDRWFRALESLETYRGTQSDMHTHVHDLPPQMGGCWTDNSEIATDLAAKIDRRQQLVLFFLPALVWIPTLWLFLPAIFPVRKRTSTFQRQIKLRG